MKGFDHLALQCFLAVAEARNFTLAASAVNRTQSAVSQQIAKLESQVGKPLIVRGKHLTLTPEGETLLRYAKQIMALQRKAMDHFQEPDIEGKIRFGVPEDFAAVLLSDVLARYTSQHPRVLLDVDCDLTLNLFDRFKRKELDLVLVKMDKPENFPNGIDVYSESLEWVGDKRFFLNPADQPIPLVLSPDPCVYRTPAIKALKKMKRQWHITVSSHSHAGKLAAVKAGMGVTVLPRNIIPKDVPMIHQGPKVPDLADTHVSLLKHSSKNPAVNSLEKVILESIT